MGHSRDARAWTAADIPDQHGRTAIVTGANQGLGFETARMLAERGATVVLACRDTVKAAAAADRIRDTAPSADIGIVALDLETLDSVRAAAEEIRADHDRIDLLINNAGTANTRRVRTADGYESTFATNHLGPFALTGLLLDRMQAVAGARIVTVSSVSHAAGVVDIDDLHFEHRRYRTLAAYSQSKLANLLFTFELHRRLKVAGASAIALAAHPGAAATEFYRNLGRGINILALPPLKQLIEPLVQSAAAGALSTLRASTDPDAQGGEFFGPTGFRGMKGPPVQVAANPRAHDEQTQRSLWEESERLTGVHPGL